MIHHLRGEAFQFAVRNAKTVFVEGDIVAKVLHQHFQHHLVHCFQFIPQFGGCIGGGDLIQGILTDAPQLQMIVVDQGGGISQAVAVQDQVVYDGQIQKTLMGNTV